jgi:hypothetical protein
MPTLKAKFQPLLEQGKTLAEQYGPQIMQQSRSFRAAGSAG